MNKFKRALCMVLAMSMVLVFVLAGCGKPAAETKDSDESKTGGQTSTQEETPKLDPVELTWYYPGVYPQPDQDIVFEQLNKITKEKINATVNFKATAWGDYEQKMKVSSASGEDYDLCFTSNWMNNYVGNVSKGAFLPIDDLLKKYAPNTWASIPEKFWDAVKLNGKIYGIINYQISAFSDPIMLPKELADKYGFNPDSIGNNLDNLEPYLKAVKQGDPKMVPIYTGWGALKEYNKQDWIVGESCPGAVYYNDSSLKVFNQYESPEFKADIERQIKWEKAGYLHGSEMISVKDINALIQQGKVGAWGGGTFAPGMEASASDNYKRPLYVRPISDAHVTTGSISGTMQAVNRNSKNPERTMMFVELMNTDKELYNTICFGIEGKHFKKTSGNYIELIKDSGYNPSTAWLFASNFNAYLLPGQPEDVWEQTKKLNESAKTSPLLGFSFNPDPVKNEIAQTNTVYLEYFKGFMCGVLSMEKDYPKFIDKMDKAGAKKIVEEMQKQVDAWKATK